MSQEKKFFVSFVWKQVFGDFGNGNVAVVLETWEVNLQIHDRQPGDENGTKSWSFFDRKF